MTQEQDDIAWMRRLAEEGATAPMGGASILMAAGLIYGVASLLHWSVLVGALALPPVALSVIWLVAVVLFFAVLIVVIMRKRGGGVVTAANRATRAVWSGVGWGIFAMMISIMVMGLRLGAEASLAGLALIPSVVMVFYGIGWAVSAAMLKSRLMAGLAAGSLIAAPVLALLTGQPSLYLAYAACLFVLMAWPGFMLVRQARAAGVA